MNKTLSLFAIRDVVSDELVTVIPSVTCGAMIRANAQMFSRVYPNFENDFEILEVGEVNPDTCLVSAYSAPVHHDWSEYKIPEKVVDKE